MVEYAGMDVKPLIESVPQVGRILEQNGIGCAQCTVGTCRLGDVVKFHGLSLKCETEMWSQIEKAIRSAGETLCLEIEEAKNG